MMEFIANADMMPTIAMPKRLPEVLCRCPLPITCNRQMPSLPDADVLNSCADC